MLISTFGLTGLCIRVVFVGISVTLAATACSPVAAAPPPPRPSLTGH